MDMFNKMLQSSLGIYFTLLKKESSFWNFHRQEYLQSFVERSFSRTLKAVTSHSTTKCMFYMDNYMEIVWAKTKKN